MKHYHTITGSYIGLALDSKPTYYLKMLLYSIHTITIFHFKTILLFDKFR